MQGGSRRIVVTLQLTKSSDSGATQAASRALIQWGRLGATAARVFLCLPL
jgi:hypothetical protein